DVAPPAALDAARALTGDADAGARVDPGRNLHLEVAPALRPASAVALRARLAIDVARSAARGTGLVEPEPPRPAHPREAVLDGALDGDLDVAPSRRPAASHEVAEIDVLGLAKAGRSPRPAQISEDRAEEIREALAALLEAHFAPPIGRAVEGPAAARSG